VQIAIPGGQIIDRPRGLRIETGLQRLHTAIALGTAYNEYADLTSDVDLAEAHVYTGLDELRLACPTRLIDTDGPGLVIQIPWGEYPWGSYEYAHLYVQYAGQGDPWRVATKMLLLAKPDINASQAAEAADVLQQERGYVTLYAALALVNNWF
jgi:hypothetical protein